MHRTFTFYLFQVTYTPLHHQSAWVTADSVALPAGLVNYGGSLPHLRPGVAANTQTFTTSSGAPVPRPPVTVRSRPLSAGARNRQLRDRQPDANVPSMRYGKEKFASFDDIVFVGSTQVCHFSWPFSKVITSSVVSTKLLCVKPNRQHFHHNYELEYIVGSAFYCLHAFCWYAYFG